MGYRLCGTQPTHTHCVLHVALQTMLNADVRLKSVRVGRSVFFFRTDVLLIGFGTLSNIFEATGCGLQTLTYSLLLQPLTYSLWATEFNLQPVGYRL